MADLTWSDYASVIAPVFMIGFFAGSIYQMWEDRRWFRHQMRKLIVFREDDRRD